MLVSGNHFRRSNDTEGSVFNPEDYSNSEWFSWILGLFLSAMAFGAICTLCFLNSSLLQKRAKQEKQKQGRISAETTCLFLYIFWACILCSGVLAVQLESTLPHRTVFIQTDKAFQNILSGLPQSIVGIACFTLVHWAFELLLMWRCYVIYYNYRRTLWLILSFEALIFLASVASGALFLVEIILKLKPKILIRLLLIHGGICLFSNLVFTHLIVIRLYIYRKTIIDLVGRRYAGHYTSLVSIFVESGMVMNLVLVSVVVAVVLHTQWLSLPLLIFPLIEALSSYVIVFRVASGSAWSFGTANDLIAQHSGGSVRDQVPTLNPSERLSAMRYRVTSQATQASTAFRFNHHTTMSSNMSQILESHIDSRQSSIRGPS